MSAGYFHPSGFEEAVEAMAVAAPSCLYVSARVVVTARRMGLRAQGMTTSVVATRLDGTVRTLNVTDPAEDNGNFLERGWPGHMVAVVVIDGQAHLVDGTVGQLADPAPRWPIQVITPIPRGWRQGGRPLQVHHDQVGDVVYTAEPGEHPTEDPLTTPAWLQGLAQPWDGDTPMSREWLEEILAVKRRWTA